MTYNAEEILKFIGQYPFDMAFNENCINDLYDCCLSARTDLIYATGATKMVIIPSNKDYVIKIPFTGGIRLTYQGSSDTNDVRDEDYVEDYCPFEYAEANDRNWDYCETEVERYALAEELGFSQFFAKPIFIGFSCDHPIYIQEKCDIYQDNGGYSSAKERTATKEFIDSQHLPNVLPLGWLADFEKYYGREVLATFVDFLHTEGWDDDLRAANVGYINERPVLVDFSSFYD